MANKLRYIQRSCRNKSFDAATSKRLGSPRGVWAQFTWLLSELACLSKGRLQDEESQEMY